MEVSLVRVAVWVTKCRALKLSTVMCRRLMLFFVLCFRAKIIASISKISVEAKNFEGVARLSCEFQLYATEIAADGFECESFLKPSVAHIHTCWPELS